MSLLIPGEVSEGSLRLFTGWQRQGDIPVISIKFQEDPAVEHYISFSPIDSEKPNFHLPVFLQKRKWNKPEIRERKRDMVLYQAKDYKDMSRKAANIISAQVIMKPNAVLGLATGSTPGRCIRTAGWMVQQRWHRFFTGNFCKPGRIQKDSSGDNDQSYRYFHEQKSVWSVKISTKARTFVPDGTEPDSKVACAKI